MLGYHPPARQTPWQEDRPPPKQGDPPGKAEPPWQGRPPLAKQTPWQGDPPGKADPPCVVHAGRYGQQAGGMHPTGMQFLLCIRPCLSCFVKIVIHIVAVKDVYQQKVSRESEAQDKKHWIYILE